MTSISITRIPFATVVYLWKRSARISKWDWIRNGGTKETMKVEKTILQELEKLKF